MILSQGPAFALLGPTIRASMPIGLLYSSPLFTGKRRRQVFLAGPPARSRDSSYFWTQGKVSLLGAYTLDANIQI